MKCPPPLLLCLFFCPGPASAETLLPEILLRPTLLQRLLPESFDLKIAPARLEIPAGDESLPLQSGGMRLRLRIPQEGLRLEVRQPTSGQFRLHWSGLIRDLECLASKLTLSVPEGFLDRAVQLSLDSLQLRFAGAGSMIRIEASLLLSGSEEGIRVEPEQLRIRFPDGPGSGPAVDWGRIRVDGTPVVSEGSTFRALLETNVPRWFRSRRAQLETGLASLIAKEVRQRLERAAKVADFELPAPLDGLRLQITPTHFLPAEPQMIRVALRPQLLGKSAAATGAREGAPTVTLPRSLPGAGLLIPESTLQELLSIPEIQSRLKSLVLDPGSTPGVKLLPQGIRVRLLHELRAVSVLLPLEIDLIRTIEAGAPLGERLRISLGDWIENRFGSGPTVKVPVEILLFPQNRDSPEESPRLQTRIPFTADGGFTAPEHCPPELCPSNVEQMSRRVRKGLMKSLHARFREQIPETIVFPENAPKNIEITPENALWITTGGT